PLEFNGLERGQSPDRNDGLWQSCGNSLDGQIEINVSERETRSARDLFTIVQLAKLRIALRHLTKGEAIALSETHRNLADAEFEHDFINTALAADGECRAQRG